jgi:hypothetical protein
LLPRAEDQRRKIRAAGLARTGVARDFLSRDVV